MGTEGYIAQPRVERNRFFDVCACVVIGVVLGGRDGWMLSHRFKRIGKEKQGSEVCGGGGDLRVTDN
jgi:prolipoprotein diacylglyceryltransferase